MNPYRELTTNSINIIRKTTTAEQKLSEFKKLHKKLHKKLFENEHLLNVSPAFATRCEHWNQLDIESIKPVTTLKNPWLSFKRQFEIAVALPAEQAVLVISKELGWFTSNSYTADWIKE
jgi:hypothetical protein